MFLKNGDCVPFCEQADIVIKTNMICAKEDKCLVENCLQCEEDNQSVCKKCYNGFFLYNNMCNTSCPANLRADRMNWLCIEPTVFAWYWVFPSNNSCREKCGVALTQESDCSCDYDCVRNGTCCQDIEEYCFNNIN